MEHERSYFAFLEPSDYENFAGDLAWQPEHTVDDQLTSRADIRSESGMSNSSSFGLSPSKGR